jgi:tryptophan-rich hypothetical protein
MPVEKVKRSNTRGCDSKASETNAADVIEGAQRVGAAQSNRVSPKKLLLSKWTAVHPERKEKHFLVTKVFEPEIEGQAIIDIELEAAMTGRKFCMPWRDLKSRERWRQGWV